ncbi:amidohydrolase family protein [Asticcacaulis sp. AND118]|nr:amidohydrolase family protein [Asticcacaulis sp. AND118]UDF04773.1 amidohydrolase family protein [Asticcacaulis sp. AND118]
MTVGAGMALAGMLLMAGGTQAATVAVKAERLIEVETGKSIEQPLVIVTDGRITAIGSALTMKPPAGVEFIDLPGVTLLPGLIDMHVHLDNSPEYGGYNGLSHTDRFWAFVAAANAEKTLKAGFTTVRNVGAGDYNDIGLREAIDEGVLPGPRIVAAGLSFGATGGHCDSTWLPPSMDSKNPMNADSPWEARKSVRTLKKYGADVIKICATSGVFSRGASVGARQLTPEEMAAVADEAHMAGMKVAAHAHGADGIKVALRSGIDTIEHASLVDDEGIRLAREKGAYFSMDIYNTDYTQSEGEKNGVAEESLRKDREIAEIQRQNYGKALKAGVKMVYGTDAGIYPHGDNARQFAVMVRYGATPLQAIQSATVIAAEALGRSNDVGSLRPGHFGDMVGVSGDPLKDVTVLERPVFVMKGGDVINKP